MSENRKLQSIGKSLYVSLPKSWVRQMELKQGDTVTLYQQSDGSLAIYPGIKEEKPRKLMLDVDSKESRQSLRRRITGAYVDGFDIIQLRTEERFTDEQRVMIRDITEALFGLEIIEVTSKLIIIQCLLTRTIPVERTIQRIHSIIGSMFNETILALKEWDTNLAVDVVKRIQDVKRLSLVTHRLLRSFILFPTENPSEMRPIDCVDFLRVLHAITEIAKSVKNIAESVSLSEQKFPRSISESMHELCTVIWSLYDNSIRALMSKDVSLANRILDAETAFGNLWNLIVRADERSEITSLTFSHIHRAFDNLGQVHSYTVEIAEIAIDRAEQIP